MRSLIEKIQYKIQEEKRTVAQKDAVCLDWCVVRAEERIKCFQEVLVCLAVTCPKCGALEVDADV